MTTRHDRINTPHPSERKRPAPASPSETENSEALDLERGLSPGQILQLQRTIGNQAVQRVLNRANPAPAGASIQRVYQPAETTDTEHVVSGLSAAPGNIVSRTGAAAEEEEMTGNAPNTSSSANTTATTSTNTSASTAAPSNVPGATGAAAP